MYRHALTCDLTFCLMVHLGWSTMAAAETGIPLQVTDTDTETTVEFNMEQLDAMPQVSFTTSTIWTDGDVVFSGVPLSLVLGAAADQGTTVEMVALNDYKVDMPISAIDESTPIVATRMNGEVMSVRDKGPYWVVFPYDDDPRYQTETIYSYSIWQLNRLKVVD